MELIATAHNNGFIFGKEIQLEEGKKYKLVIEEIKEEKINPKILALTGLIKNEEVFDMELGEKMDRREWTFIENQKEIINVIDKATGDRITTVEISKEDLKRIEQREGKKYKEVLGILIHKFATGEIKI